VSRKVDIIDVIRSWDTSGLTGKCSLFFLSVQVDFCHVVIFGLYFIHEIFTILLYSHCLDLSPALVDIGRPLCDAFTFIDSGRLEIPYA